MKNDSSVIWLKFRFPIFIVFSPLKVTSSPLDFYDNLSYTKKESKLVISFCFRKIIEVGNFSYTQIPFVNNIYKESNTINPKFTWL